MFSIILYNILILLEKTKKYKKGKNTYDLCVGIICSNLRAYAYI